MEKNYLNNRLKYLLAILILLVLVLAIILGYYRYNFWIAGTSQSNITPASTPNSTPTTSLTPTPKISESPSYRTGDPATFQPHDWQPDPDITKSNL